MRTPTTGRPRAVRRPQPPPQPRPTFGHPTAGVQTKGLLGGRLHQTPHSQGLLLLPLEARPLRHTAATAAHARRESSDPEASCSRGQHHRNSPPVRLFAQHGTANHPGKDFPIDLKLVSRCTSTRWWSSPGVIDTQFADDRERGVMAKRREDLRNRLGPVLYGTHRRARRRRGRGLKLEMVDAEIVKTPRRTVPQLNPMQSLEAAISHR